MSWGELVLSRQDQSKLDKDLSCIMIVIVIVLSCLVSYLVPCGPLMSYGANKPCGCRQKTKNTSFAAKKIHKYIIPVQIRNQIPKKILSASSSSSIALYVIPGKLDYTGIYCIDSFIIIRIELL